MKIRNRHLVRLAGRAASLAARGLARSLRFEYLPLDRPLGPTPVAAEPRPGDRSSSCCYPHLSLPTCLRGTVAPRGLKA